MTDSAQTIIARELSPGQHWDYGVNQDQTNAISKAERIISALKAAGWAVVPVEPTEAMIKAGNDYARGGSPEWAHEIYGSGKAKTPEGIYKAMIEGEEG